MLKVLTTAALGAAAAAAVVSTATPTPAYAQTLVDAANPQSVLQVARGWGSATLETDSRGKPKIKGRAKGHAYVIWFYGCQDGRNCQSIQLWSGYNKEGVSLKTINDWNRGKLFGSAHIDRDGDPILTYDVNLDNGVTRANFDDTFSLWIDVIVGDFKEHIGWNQ